MFRGLPPINNRIISVTGLSYSYPRSTRRALKDLSVDVRAGRITGLVGPDGAGKTTLMRLIAGLLKPAEGRIDAAGLDPVHQPAQLHEILGYMPQRFGLYEDLTVMENLKLYADLRGVTGPAREAAFERLLEFTDLKRFTARAAGRLSGGMKQKLGLACALIKRPRLLLLDEPSVGVDPISRRELWRMVRELVDAEMAVLWSTAYLDETEQCDEVILINEGNLLFAGIPRDLTDRAKNRVWLVEGLPPEARRRVLAKALGHASIMDGVVQGSMLRLVKKKGADSPAPADLGLASDLTIRLKPAQPRFEDAFIDILGGGPGGRSLLAERMRTIVDDGAPVVVADGLTKRFGSFTAVSENSFKIHRGEIFGLLGPNGAGKSTTFKMMCGLLEPTEGHGEVAGVDLRKSASRARARLGYMAQKFSLYGDLSVAQNLQFFAGIYGLGGTDRRQAMELAVEVFGLAPHLKTAAKDLSLGFKQRLSLSCAVMHGPDVLFLDEPTSGVDPITRREFWTHINGLVEKGVTILVTTHFMDEAEYCDRIGLIYRGRKIAEGPPDALKEQTRTVENPDPTLEDAFIELVRRSDMEGSQAA